jgi:excisionase family DNA binding protein
MGGLKADRLMSLLDRLVAACERIAGQASPSGEATNGVSGPAAPELLGPKQVALLLGCSYGEARLRMLDGRIRAVKDGRWCRTRREWVEEYLERMAVRP